MQICTILFLNGISCFNRQINLLLCSKFFTYEERPFISSHHFDFLSQDLPRGYFFSIKEQFLFFNWWKWDAIHVDFRLFVGMTLVVSNVAHGFLFKN